MSASQVDLMEAIGAGPDSETVVSSITILASDQHSGGTAFMRRRADGAPVYSCERWLRLRFQNPAVQVGNVRFWVPNYDPAPGWQLRMGASSIYRKPGASRSDIAVSTVPTADPGYLNPNVFPSAPNSTVDLSNALTYDYSAWIVLQASWVGDEEVLQGPALTFSFAWDEG